MRTRAVWPVLAAMVLFPLLNYAVPLWTASFLLSTASITVAYGLGIYLIRGIAIAAVDGRVVLIIVAGVIMAVVGGAASHPRQLLMMEANWGAIVTAGLLTGRLALAEKSQLKLYLWGLAVVLAGGIIMWAPQWTMIMQSFSDSTGEVATRAREMLMASGYNEEMADDTVRRMRNMMDVVIRLIPTGTVMNIVAQFSVGFLWFLYRGVPSKAAVGELKPFRLWKAPFGLTPVLIVAILALQFGGETLELAAVNVLAALSIFYCVTGLALLEHLMTRLKVPLWFKVLFYIMLTLSGLIGYFGAALLGFIDSFADWRKVSKTAISLNNSD